MIIFKEVIRYAPPGPSAMHEAGDHWPYGSLGKGDIINNSFDLTCPHRGITDNPIFMDTGSHYIMSRVLI